MKYLSLSLLFLSNINNVYSSGNCGGCSGDNVNDYVEIEISGMTTALFGASLDPSYDFDGTWEAVGACGDGYAYYEKTDVWNIVYETDEPFYLRYNSDSDKERWEITQTIYTDSVWAYCNKESIEDCNNLWYVRYGNDDYDSDCICYPAAYQLDSSVTITGVTDDSCSDDTDDIDTTPSPTQDSECYSNSDSAGTCLIGNNFYYSFFNDYWQAMGCYNDRVWYECLNDYCDNYDGTRWSMYYNYQGYWIINFGLYEGYDKAYSLGYCGENELLDCSNGGWTIAYSTDADGGFSTSDDDNCDSARSDDNSDDTSDLSIYDTNKPYGSDLSDESDSSSSSDSSDDNALEWWVWLLIGLGIVVVVGISVFVGIRMMRGNNNKAMKYKMSNSDKNDYLLQTN